MTRRAIEQMINEGAEEMTIKFSRNRLLFRILCSDDLAWTANGVATVMRNERYCGDVLPARHGRPTFTTTSP